MKSVHIHKYQRVIMGGTKVVIDADGKRRLEKRPGTIVFKCMHPGCPTYKLREMVIGDKSICWKCGSEMLMNMENTTLKKPTHMACRKSRSAA